MDRTILETVLHRFFNIIGAGLVAVVILSLFTLIYSYSGTHVDNTSGATDYRWMAGQYKSNMVEGFTWTKADANGFNNTYPNHYWGNGILLMGSSHMEAFNVPQDKNTANVLNSLLENNNSNMHVYNIGMSGHTIYRCAKNIEAAINEYKPTSYVIIETSTIQLDTNSIYEVLDDRLLKIKSYDSGLIYQLQRIPCLKLLYKQLEAIRQGNISDNEGLSTTVESVNKPNKLEYVSALNQFMAKIQASAESHGCQLIIFYHPTLFLNKDGSAYTKINGDYLSMFADSCKRNNIMFVDMSDTFMSAYKENYILPNGFSNTSIGSGHLNENGHKMIANKLYEVIKSREKENRAKETN